MRKLLTVAGALLLFAFFSPYARAQQTRIAERDAEWNQLVQPQSTFVRLTDPSDIVLFRVPVEWNQTQPGKLEFSGPHGATLTVFTEKIPDGVPLREFVSGTMQELRRLSYNADSILLRRTTMSALEAREIMFESSESTDVVSRRILWSTVSGPNAVSFLLIVPIANVAEIEPYFKAVVQSVTLIDNNEYASFHSLRDSLVKDNKPIRIDEVQLLTEALTTLDGSSRGTHITRLAAIFAAAPDSVIDMVLDSRPTLRAAVIEAIALSRNSALEKFLIRALGDREPYVAEKAALAVASNPNVIDLLREQSLKWNDVESVSRAWPFLTRNNQIRILEEIFKETAAASSTIGRPDPKLQNSTGKEKGTPQPTIVLIKSPPPGSAINSGLTSPEHRRQLNGLTLMRGLPALEFKLPLNSILAAKDDALTTLALQIAWSRNELLPVPELLNLLSSKSNEIRWLASLNLGQSASVADIKSIEDILNKTVVAAVPPGEATKPGSSTNSEQWFRDALQVTIKKIRLREKLSTTSGDARQQLIKEALADPKLTEWVWYRFIQENANGKLTGAAKVLPLGENLFPKDVTYYAAFPNPDDALDKFTSALNGLQLESARSQASLVLILSTLREQLAQQLDSPPGAAPMVYSGINFKEPIALARWYADGAPHGIQSAERKAIIIRVTDRARFERTLTLYQRSIGNFNELTDYVSGGVRLLTVLPVFLPLSAKAMLERSPTPAAEVPLLKYSFVGGTAWNGYPVKVMEQRSVARSGYMTSDAAFLTYVGDTAVLAPNLESLHDVLTRATTDRETLATNSYFKRLAENPGEAIYLSNLAQLNADPTKDEVARSQNMASESGTLKVSNLTWENFYQIHFNQGDWLKPFVPFQPQTLVSPRELLPRTTVAYYFMNFDSVAAWNDWSKQALGPDERKDMSSIWAIDFEKEVLPELGPECGVALLGLPSKLIDNRKFPIAIFFKLKSDKLVRALETDRLFNGGTTRQGVVQFKFGSSDVFAVIKSNFLVLSNTRNAIDALENKEKLSASRDFSRAAKQVPADLVAFGGYNLEAAISAVGDSGADPIETQKSALISSLANAFHSPNFYATATSDAVQGRFSLSMDREGRFSVSELASLSKDYRLTYAQIEARGVPVLNQESLSSLKLRIRAKADGEIDRLRDDVTSPYQTVEKISERELLLSVLPRHIDPKSNLTLPIKGAEFTAYLQPANEIRSDDKSVIEKAKSIAGDERDAWKVAQKLAEWTYSNIKWKRVDNATAPQTLATLEADCLEFSQLYVAMARSLGIPARMVSGLAFSGASFGGHAWVEVYVGDWVEVDPTWGTDFVDATHIRNSADGSLLTYASLNLVELEVLEAPRGIAEFQKDPRTLAETLCRELSTGNTAALISALDLSVLTNEKTGLGKWETLSDSEREVMTSAYHRILLEIPGGLTAEPGETHDLRLVKVKSTADTAEALVITPGVDELLAKFSFVRRNGAWLLTEVLQVDTGFHIISEILQPAIGTILDRRVEKAAKAQPQTAFFRVLTAAQKDPGVAVTIAEAALKDDPKNQGMRHIKAMALMLNKKRDDAIQLLKELVDESKPYPPAVHYLAFIYSTEEDDAKKKLAIEYYIRYRELEPDDVRTYPALGDLYVDTGDEVRAEAEYRAGLKSDPLNVEGFVYFAGHLALRRRFKEAVSIVDEAEPKSSAGQDRFGALMTRLYYTDDKTVLDQLALSQPARMAKSAVANLYLGYTRLDNGKNLQAITLFKKAAALKNDWSEPYEAMSRGYRDMRNWTAALKAADTAVTIDVQSSQAHVERACALARLGRIDEAIQALEKALEIDPDYAKIIEDEDDLKVLASNPAFKKMMTVENQKK